MINSPPWLDVALAEVGVEEVPGPGDNSRIVEYHKACDDTETGDEIAWCSSFVNWCMLQRGFQRTRSRAARSWLKWGNELPLSAPAYGCVVILWRESKQSWKGHAGFYLGEVGDFILMLGGNQNNEVCIKLYPKSRVLSYRWAT